MIEHRAAAPKSVVFDFGGVLIRWEPEIIAARFYADPLLRDRALSEVFQHIDWFELDRGTLSDELAVERFAARMGCPVTEMWRFLAHVRDSLVPIDESFALVRRLQQLHVRLFGLSNMPAKTFAHLRQRYEVWSCFEGIVISGEILMAKPEPRIFEHLSHRYRLNPEETLFIDDHPPNISCARQLGFRTILFSSPAQCAAELSACFPSFAAGGID